MLPLIYHRIISDVADYSYALHTSAFKAHLQVLSSAPSSARLTFDDGNRTQHEHALPLIEEFGLKAVFFITAGWTDSQPGSMSSAHLRELASLQYTIGAHGMTHKLLPHCSDQELKVELVDAKARLEHILGRAVTCMSLPGGRYDRRVLDACAEAGYADVYTSEPTNEERWSGKLRLIGRYNVRKGLAPERLAALIAPNSRELRREMRKVKLKQFGQQLIGDDNYHRLWMLLSRSKPKTT